MSEKTHRPRMNKYEKVALGIFKRALNQKNYQASCDYINRNMEALIHLAKVKDTFSDLLKKRWNYRFPTEFSGASVRKDSMFEENSPSEKDLVHLKLTRLGILSGLQNIMKDCDMLSEDEKNEREYNKYRLDASETKKLESLKMGLRFRLINEETYNRLLSSSLENIAFRLSREEKVLEEDKK